VTALDTETLIDGLIGKPFAWLARGPESFYCLGLWLHLVEVLRGIRIEDPFIEPNEQRLREFWHRFLPVDFKELRPLDVLFWRWSDQTHVATVENERWVVSVSREGGVHRMPLLEAVLRAEKAYRLRDLW